MAPIMFSLLALTVQTSAQQQPGLACAQPGQACEISDQPMELLQRELDVDASDSHEKSGGRAQWYAPPQYFDPFGWLKWWHTHTVTTRIPTTATTTTTTTTTTTPPVSIYFDGVTPTPVPRQLIDSKPMRMFYSVPLSAANSGVSVNATHAFIKSGAELQSFYIRNMTVRSGPGWTLDYGVANQRWFPNPVSAFPQVTFGAAEKLTQFGQGGFTSKSTLKRVRKEIQSRNFLSEMHAKGMSEFRSLLVNLHLLQSRMGSSLVNAGLDLEQVRQLAALATDAASANRSRLDPETLELALTLTEFQESFKPADAVVSSNDCFHFRAHTTDDGMAVPLGQGKITFRGQVSFSPFSQFSAVTATTTMKHNAEANTLEIYVEGSSLIYMEDLTDMDKPAAPVYFQGPPHTGVDGREQRSKASLIDYTLYTLYRSIPRYYGFFWERDTCPQGKLHSVHSDLKAANFPSAVHETPNAIEALTLMQTAVSSMACGQSFMQSSIPNSHSYGAFEAFVWVHMLLEVPTNLVGQVSTWQGWNDLKILSSSRKDKPPAGEAGEARRHGRGEAGEARRAAHDASMSPAADEAA